MAVHVIRQPNNYINTGLFNTAFGILGDQINGMANRSAEAKKATNRSNDWKTLSEGMTPSPAQAYQPLNEGEGPFSSLVNETFQPTWDNMDGLGKARQGNVNDLASAMGRVKDPSIFEDALKLYGNRFANQEKEDYANRISDTFNARGGYDRNNESQTMGNMVFADLAGAAPGNYAANVAPNMQGQIVDAGNKQVPMRFNPITGDWTEGTSMDVGVNPSVKYQSDTGLAQTKLNVAATRAAAGAQPKFSLVQGEDGQIYAFDQRTGGVYQNGQLVPNARGAGKSIGLGEQQKIEEAVGSIIQLSANEEDFKQRLNAFSQQNPQYAQLIQQAANSPQIWGPKGLLNEPKPVQNPYYKNPAVTQWRETFPEETARMTDEQVIVAIQKAAQSQ